MIHYLYEKYVVICIIIFCSDELLRNRNKVMEISYFLDKQREAFDHIQEEIENENDD